MSFSDFRNELIDYEGDYLLTPFQFEEYIIFMLTEIENINCANKELQSPLFRVYSYFLRYRTSNMFQIDEKQQKFRISEFADKFLPQLLRNSENELSILANDEEHPNSGIVEQISWNKLIDNKMLFKKDFRHLKKFYNKTYKIPYYKRALIWGVKFRARGIDFLELNEPTLKGNYGQQDKESVPSNNKNDWKSTNIVYDNLLASSLCLVRKHGANENIIHFCQINSFSRINEPMEPLLHGKLICTVVTRDCSGLELKVHSKQNVKYENLYKSNLIFLPTLTMVDIKDIYPCPLAITPLDKDGEPVIINRKTCLNNTKTESLLIMLLERNRQVIIDNQEINSLYIV